MKPYLIYKATSPSNKVYIGMTYKAIDERQKEHEALAKNGKKVRIFQNALKKYDLDFKWEIIAEGLTKIEAEQEEKRFIELYKSTEREFGYNLSPGGLAGSIMSEGGKKRHKEKMETYWSIQENRQRASDKTKELVNKDPEAFSERCTQAIKEYWSKNYEQMCTPIICNETGEIFKSQKIAADKLNIFQPNINKVLKKERKHTKGYSFKYVGE